MKLRPRFRPAGCRKRTKGMRSAGLYSPQSTRVLAAKYCDGFRKTPQGVGHGRPIPSGRGTEATFFCKLNTQQEPSRIDRATAGNGLLRQSRLHNGGTPPTRRKAAAETFDEARGRASARDSCKWAKTPGAQTENGHAKKGKKLFVEIQKQILSIKSPRKVGNLNIFAYLCTAMLIFDNL